MYKLGEWVIFVEAPRSPGEPGGCLNNEVSKVSDDNSAVAFKG